MIASPLAAKRVELQNGEPIIWHGATLASKILFSDVIKTCKKWAFVTSQFPVILSIENHASKKQQITMAHYLKEILGDMLIIKKIRQVNFFEKIIQK